MSLDKCPNKDGQGSNIKFKEGVKKQNGPGTPERVTGMEWEALLWLPSPTVRRSTHSIGVRVSFNVTGCGGEGEAPRAVMCCSLCVNLFISQRLYVFAIMKCSEQHRRTQCQPLTSWMSYCLADKELWVLRDLGHTILTSVTVPLFEAGVIPAVPAFGRVWQNLRSTSVDDCPWENE